MPQTSIRVTVLAKDMSAYMDWLKNPSGPCFLVQSVDECEVEIEVRLPRIELPKTCNKLLACGLPAGHEGGCNTSA